jgi:hypothetical protein
VLSLMLNLSHKTNQEMTHSLTDWPTKFIFLISNTRHAPDYFQYIIFDRFITWFISFVNSKMYLLYYIIFPTLHLLPFIFIYPYPYYLSFIYSTYYVTIAIPSLPSSQIINGIGKNNSANLLVQLYTAYSSHVWSQSA